LVAFADGGKEWVPLDANIARDDVLSAIAAADEVTREAVAGAWVTAKRGAQRETIAAYAIRWLASREGRVTRFATIAPGCVTMSCRS
jgi:hypothetical protein